MHSLKFLLDADMPRSSGEVIRNLGFNVEDVRDIGLRAAKDKEIIEYAFTSKEINERLEEFFKSVGEDDLRGMITIVELSRYRKRRIN